MERPVIVSGDGGSKELIEDGRTGFVLPERSSCALSALAVRLAKDGRLRIECGRAARLSVVEQFSVQSMVSKTIALYEDAVAGRLNSSAMT